MERLSYDCQQLICGFFDTVDLFRYERVNRTMRRHMYHLEGLIWREALNVMFLFRIQPLSSPLYRNIARALSELLVSKFYEKLIQLW